LLGKVHYNPDIISEDYACRKLPFIGDSHKVDSSPIIMVHRGNCTFVTKVRNVENAGGHVALIINNIDEPINRIVMSDDGRGRELNIPGVLISKSDGEILTNYIAQNKDRAKDIILEVEFEMEHPSNIVQYDFFLSSDSEAIYKLMNDFYFYEMNLRTNTHLTVHYTTIQHPLYNESSKDNIERLNCLGKGKYCANPGNFGTVDGREIVFESIKQKCIYNYAYGDASQPLLYWLYMRKFYQICLNIETPKLNRECSAVAVQTLGLPSDIINKCVHDSFIADSNSDRLSPNFELYAENSILNSGNENRELYFMNYIPSITINGRSFWGSWRADTLFEAICAGFNKKPDVCYDEGAFKRTSSVGAGSIILIILIIILINATIFYFCRNYIRSKIVERIESTDINHKINTVVTSYLALRENK
jgi:hypothetical protein